MHGHMNVKFSLTSVSPKLYPDKYIYGLYYEIKEISGILAFFGAGFRRYSWQLTRDMLTYVW
jgi:hypothetical protein